MWLNALIESAGGHIIEETADNPEDIELGLDTEAGKAAATVMNDLATSGAVGPAFSTAGEDSSVTDFEEGDAAFMVNWPFVWGRALARGRGRHAGPVGARRLRLDDLPGGRRGRARAPPYGGINLGIGAFSENVDAAYEAAECIVSEENQAYYFTSNGNPAAKASVYDDPEVIEVFPQAPVIRESLEMAKPRPQTVYYSEVSGALQREYHPADRDRPGDDREAGR